MLLLAISWFVCSEAFQLIKIICLFVDKKAPAEHRPSDFPITVCVVIVLCTYMNQDKWK